MALEGAVYLKYLIYLQFEKLNCNFCSNDNNLSYRYIIVEISSFRTSSANIHVSSNHHCRERNYRLITPSTRSGGPRKSHGRSCVYVFCEHFALYDWAIVRTAHRRLPYKKTSRLIPGYAVSTILSHIHASQTVCADHMVKASLAAPHVLIRLIYYMSWTAINPKLQRRRPGCVVHTGCVCR